ncbi:MAG TPA: ATP-binding protein [Thermoanaerobaculia bacterium]|jgi:signal transduction histidine kinase|nr:ATP-binding protein [Thermoanaerobaculia bacterium]
MMRRLSLSTLLIGLNAGVVLIAVVAVAVAAVGLIERFAQEQALARVSLAGASAQEAVERSARDVATSAHLLAERPTVKRLLGERDVAGLTAFLDRFRSTSHLSGVVIFSSGRVFATGGATLPWETIARRAGAEGSSSLTRLPDGSLLLAAASPLASSPESSAAAALVLDAPFARQIEAQVGLPVTILDPEHALADPDDPSMPLRAEVLASGEPGSGLLKKAGRYLSVRPLRTPAGEVAALVETGLPRNTVAGSLARLVRNLILLTLLVAALATLSGWAVSRRLTRPVEALTAAAARIGRGDLSTPAPRAPGAELGTLAATMEEMRRRLLQVTSELRRRQAEGEAILTGITEGVFSVDRDRRITYLNPQTAALLSIRREEALGRFCGDVLNPRGRDGVRPCEESCPIVHARFRGGASATEHLQLRDGGQRAVVIASAPPAEEQQFQVLRDETGVEAARRQRDAVLANVSHELRTPLSAQLASIELLRDRLRQSPGGLEGETRDLVLSLERGSLRLTQLIDNLLESVRIESGQDSIRSRPVALDEVIEDAVEMTAPLLAQRGQSIEVDLPYPLPAVRGDAPRLTQVFVNLLANANKFGPPGSVVHVGGVVEEGAVCLWVEDEGPGFPVESGSGALFDRFVRRAGEGEEPETSGMGLGLWIVRSIVERHGGAVEARPGSGERGTRMRVLLPRGLPRRGVVEGTAA